MGLLQSISQLRRRWFGRREEPSLDVETTRRCLFESMEERVMFSASPLHLGGVYIEEDSGGDHHGDTFEIKFEGGAPGTQLTRLEIDGDHGPAGLSFGDMIFDTVKGGLGADEAFAFQVMSSDGIGSVQATVVDGSSKLVLDFTGFDVGEKLVFSIDVDEVQEYDASVTDLGIINQGIDPIASGVEFQGSQLKGTFAAPNYYDVSGSGQFRNLYDPLFAGTNLLLTSSNPTGLSPDDYQGKRDRSTGSHAQLQQSPVLASLSGYVYVDANNNGLRDTNERGIGGVAIQVIPEEAIEPQQAVNVVTLADGSYNVQGLMPGRYRVVEVHPTDYYDGLDAAGTVAGAIVGTATNPGDRLDGVQLAGGQAGVEYNFGELEPGSIRGNVRITGKEGNCFGEGTTPIQGAKVQLLNAAGDVLQEAFTDASGNYAFTNLAPGTYSVREFTPEGLIDTASHIGTINGGLVGSKIDAGLVTNIVIGSGQNGVDYSFCESMPSTLSGRVFHDADDDGTFDTGETPIAGVSIQLIGSGDFTANAVTNVDGYYEFVGLRSGVYAIVETQPEGWLDGQDHIGNIDGEMRGNKASSVDDDRLFNVPLAWRENGVQFDFGELKPASISGIVHVDNDRDLLPDADDRRLSDVTIELLNAAGEVVARTVTDDEGRYRFDGLRPGVYSIRESQPTGLFQGGQVAGSHGGDAATTDLIVQIPVASGDALINYNFCELEPADIAGRVHIDSTRNNQYDAGESPLAGVTIELLDAQGNIVQLAVTDAEGRYAFVGLPPGSYAVRERQPTYAIDGGQAKRSGDGDASGENAITNITIVPGAHLVEYNFQELLPGVISGYVFRDGAAIVTKSGNLEADVFTYRDGVLSGDDSRLAGVTLRLFDALNGIEVLGESTLPGTNEAGPLTAVTNAQGFYEFRGLRPGLYAVLEAQPQGYVDAVDTPGNTGGTAVNTHRAVSSSVVAPFVAAGVDLDYDAIVRIGISNGGHSQNNNFSEVIVEKEIVKTKTEERLIPTPQVITRPTLEPAPFVAPAPAPTYTLPPQLLRAEEPAPQGGAAEYTWHLSVMNGGSPRGNYRNFRVDKPAEMQPAKYLELSQWKAERLKAGQWVLPQADEATRRKWSEAVPLFGMVDAIPLTGDFNGDGVSEFVLFHEGEWFIDVNGNGRWDENDLWARLGTKADQPVVGDWDGDGKDDIGIFGPEWPRDPIALEHERGLPDVQNPPKDRAKNVPPHEPEAAGLRTLQLTRRGDRRWDVIDHVLQFGGGHDIAVSGDFNGDGIDTIGVFRAGVWRLDVNGDGRFTDIDKTLKFGAKGDRPIVGDFDGDGIDEIGIYRDGKWYIDINHNGEIDAADKVFELGGGEDQPIVGDFNSDGIDEPGLHRMQGTSRVARRP